MLPDPIEVLIGVALLWTLVDPAVMPGTDVGRQLTLANGTDEPTS